jgi:hypothetical protein
MLSALGDTLMELLGSKKFLMLLATVIVALAAKLGWHVTTDQLLPWLGLAASAILAQGVADHGKGKAEEEGRTQVALAKLGASTSSVVTVGAAMAAPATPPKTELPGAGEHGFVDVGAMIFCAAVLTVAAVSIAACGWWSSSGKGEAKAAAIDCTTGELAKLIPIAAVMAPKIGDLGWAAVEDAAVAAGEDVGGCLLAHLANAVHSTSFEGEPPGRAAIARFKQRTKSTAKLHTATADY